MAALALCSASPSASALDLNEWIPGLKLSPFLGERVEYETNVFQVPSHSQADVVFKTIPGFLADYTFGPHSISLGYRAEILRWVQLTAQDTVNNIAVAQARFDFPRLLINFRDDFTQTNDPPNSELTGPIKSTTNVLAPETEYRITDRFSIGANYAWSHIRFEDPSLAVLLDRDEQLVGASVFWKFLPRADLRLQYTYGRKDFTESSDRNVQVNTITIGLRGDLTAKLSSTFRIGVESRTSTPIGPGYLGPVGGGDFIYRPTEQTTITLLLDRSVQESSFGDTPFYVTTNAALGAQQRITRKFTAGLRAGGGTNQYPTKQTINGLTTWRQDWFFGAGATADYQIQPWLYVGAEYAHTFRRSNFNTFDYGDDKVTGKFTLQF
jgi:hypothetical protein